VTARAFWTLLALGAAAVLAVLATVAAHVLAVAAQLL